MPSCPYNGRANHRTAPMASLYLSPLIVLNAKVGGHPDDLAMVTVWRSFLKSLLY